MPSFLFIKSIVYSIPQSPGVNLINKSIANAIQAECQSNDRWGWSRKSVSLSLSSFPVLVSKLIHSWSEFLIKFPPFVVLICNWNSVPLFISFYLLFLPVFANKKFIVLLHFVCSFSLNNLSSTCSHSFPVYHAAILFIYF